MNKKQIQKVKNALRRLNRSDHARGVAKKRCFVSAGIYQCENCKVLCYCGTSEANLIKNAEHYGEIFTIKKEKWRKGKLIVQFGGHEIDHIKPVVEGDNGNLDWNVYIERMFPEKANDYSGLCAICHSIKSHEEEIDRGRRADEWDNFLTNLFGWEE